MASLNRSYKMLALAADLGIKPSADPTRDILAYCEKRVRRFLRDFPDCHTLTELLDIVASKLGTKFEAIKSDEELLEVRDRYARLGERSFATLPDDLDDGVFGITFRRIAKRPWELPFVSLIDCRGDKCFRSYYTKWHELGHLLILTDQMRLSFRRTHAVDDHKDPEESMVDVIAGTFGYFKDIVRPMANRALSWENIDALRTQLCPESSQQAAVIGIVKSWPMPALLVQATLGLKRGEKRQLDQDTFDFAIEPVPVLRAVQVTPNDAARRGDLVIFPNMRVPVHSIIHRVFAGEMREAQAEEDLEWWESSDGARLPSLKIQVLARRTWNAVQALITTKT
jgi:hypothetical protein